MSSTSRQLCRTSKRSRSESSARRPPDGARHLLKSLTLLSVASVSKSPSHLKTGWLTADVPSNIPPAEKAAFSTASVKKRPRVMSAATSALRQSGHACICKGLPNVPIPPGQMVIRSINVGSSTGAFELLTRFETGQRCNKSSGAGCSSSIPASPLIHGSKSRSASMTGMRS